MMADPTTKMQRYRARQKAGRRVVLVELTPEIEGLLVGGGWLDLQDLENRIKVGEAIARLLRWWNQAAGSNAETPFRAVTGNSASGPTRATGGNHEDDK